MLFEIYSLPKSTDRVWIDLRLGTICDAVEWNYTKRFCGAGTFSLTIPRTSLFASQIEVGCMLALTNKDEVNNSEDKYEGFIVKNILRKNDTIKITGYDLNGLLLDRVTLAETQDGKDAQSGATETIVKHYVAANCAESTDADRNFPGFETAPDQGRGLVNDAASPRLSRVSDVVNDILGAAGMGYRIYPNLHRVDKPAIVFEVLEEMDRTDEQSENPRVIFAYGHGNITEMTRETGVTADRNTFYCEYNGGYITRYDKKSAEQAAKYSGYGRREEFLGLSCELAEVEVYAEHEVADRYRETDSLEIVAGNPLDYGRVYNVGDIVTVYDRDRGVKLNSVISAAEIKKTATEYSVNITLGDAKPKPLDILGKSGTSVAAVIRQNVAGVVSSLAPVNSYDYLSDSSIKINNTTFNVEKNAAGLITKVTDNWGNALEPSGGDNITDIALHNAVFWATVAARGINKSVSMLGTMPEMRGIIGYFIPEKLRIADSVWLDYFGTNNITLHGGTNKAESLCLNRDEYGSFKSNAEPMTIYIVFKNINSYDSYTTIIAKHMSSTDQYHGFDITSRTENKHIMLSCRFSTVESQESSSYWHVVCITRNDTRAKLYIDGRYIGYAECKLGSYEGDFLVNRCIRGGSESDSSGDHYYKMIAFGSEEHTDNQVVLNSEWLMKKYKDITGEEVKTE